MEVGMGSSTQVGECGLRSKDSLLNLTRGKSMWELADLVRRVCGSWSAAFFSVKEEAGIQPRVRMGKEALET